MQRRKMRKMAERIFVCFLSFLMVFTMLDFSGFTARAAEMPDTEVMEASEDGIIDVTVDEDGSPDDEEIPDEELTSDEEEIIGEETSDEEAGSENESSDPAETEDEYSQDDAEVTESLNKAETDTEDEEIVTLTLGEETEIHQLSYGYYWSSFTAQTSGMYKISISNGEGYYSTRKNAYFYADKEGVSFDSNSTYDNFSKFVFINKGETLYLRTQAANSSDFIMVIGVESVDAAKLDLDEEKNVPLDEYESNWYYFEAPEDGIYQFNISEQMYYSIYNSLAKAITSNAKSNRYSLLAGEMIFFQIKNSSIEDLTFSVRKDATDELQLSEGKGSIDIENTENTAKIFYIGFQAPKKGLYRFYYNTSTSFSLYKKIQGSSLKDSESYNSKYFLDYYFEENETVSIKVQVPASSTKTLSVSEMEMKEAVKDETVNVELNEDNTRNDWYSFTAKESGIYELTLYASGTYSDYAYIYEGINDKKISYTISATKSTAGTYYVDMNADETFYFKIKTNTSNKSGGNFTIVKNKGTVSKEDENVFVLTDDNKNVKLDVTFDPAYKGIKWDAKLSGTGLSSRNTYYVIFYYREKGTDKWIATARKSIDSYDGYKASSVSYPTNLKPGTEYEYRVVLNKSSEIPLTEFEGDIIVTTLDSEDDVILSPEQYGTLIHLYSCILSEEISSTDIQYKEKTADEWMLATTVNASNEKMVYLSVKANTEYEFRAVGENENEEVIYTKEPVAITTGDIPVTIDVSISEDDISNTSATIRVNLSDYSGGFAGDSTYMYVGVEYTNIDGEVKRESNSGGTWYKSEKNRNGYLFIYFSNLEAGKEYNIPMWIAENNFKDEACRSYFKTLTFKTKDSVLKDTFKAEFTGEGQDAGTIKYNFSLNTTDTEGFASYYNYSIFYQRNEEEPVKITGRFNKSDNFEVEDKITSLSYGAKYKIWMIIGGMRIDFGEVQAAEGGVTPQFEIDPLCLGAKLKISLSGEDIDNGTGSYTVNAYIDTTKLNFAVKNDYSSYNNASLTSSNNYEGEWLIYHNEMLPDTDYTVKVSLYDSSKGTPIYTENISFKTTSLDLYFEQYNVGGSRAVYRIKIDDADDYIRTYYQYINALVYYREKDSEEEWKLIRGGTYRDYFTIYSYMSDEIKLTDLNPETTYEIKAVNYKNKDYIYCTDEFTTKKGIEKGSFSSTYLAFSGYSAHFYGYYTPADSAISTKLYFLQFDEKGNEIERKNLDWSESLNYYSDNVYLNDKTASVKIVAEEHWDYDDNGDEIIVINSTPVYNWTEKPDAVFTASNAKAGVSTLTFDISYTGDLKQNSGDYLYISYEFRYGTDKNKETWKKYSNETYFYGNTEKTKSVTVTGLLEPNTTYYGEIEVGFRVYNYDTAQYEFKHSNVLDLKSFKTKTNTTYEAAKIFPDEVFRNMILKYAGLESTADKITTADLEKITSIYQVRNDFNPAVKSLKGIEYLTELTSFTLQNHEVADITGVDWSKLSKLRTLSLIGNDITKIPDFSKNSSLTSINLNKNLLPASELNNYQSKIPARASFSYSLQRTEGISIITADKYYQMDGKNPVIVKINGAKELPYTYHCTVDDIEIVLSKVDYYNEYQANWNAGFELGDHTLKVEMYEEEKLLKSHEATFSFVKDYSYTDKSSYHFPKSVDKINISLHSMKEAQNAFLMDGDKIIAEQMGLYSSQTSTDSRYECFGGSLPKVNGYSTSIGLNSVSYGLYPEGVYDFVIEYADGTKETFSGLVEITSVPVVSGVSSEYGYDNTGNYFYLTLQGSNLDPAQLTYSFSHLGKEVKADYVNAKDVANGYILKFKKGTGWPSDGKSIQVSLGAKSGYDVIFEKNTALTDLYTSFIYYYCYNSSTKNFELAISADQSSSSYTYKLTSYDSWEDYNNKKNGTEYEFKKSASAPLTYITPTKNGKVLEAFSGYKYFYLQVIDSGTKAVKWSNAFYIGNGYITSTDARWSGNSIIGQNGEWKYTYYTGKEYSDKELSNYDIKILDSAGSAVEDAVTVSYEKSYWSDKTYRLNIVNTIITSKLNVNEKYEIAAYYKGEFLSSTEFRVAPADKFVLYDSTLYPSWDSDTSFNLTISTPNVEEGQEFTVSLTDIQGNKVEGLTTKIKRIYSTTVYLSVEGLNKKDAYKRYYIKVTSKLGDPYKYTWNSDELVPFFTNDKGIFTTISDTSGFSAITSNSRIVGTEVFDNVEFPVTVKVFRPYDTDLINSIKIMKDDLEVKENITTRYYFKSDFINKLPDKDGVYDLIFEDANGLCSVYSKFVLGLNGATSDVEWSLSTTALNLSITNEERRTGTITVYNSKGNPAFKSNDTDVATVKVSEENKNQAIVTAVEEGTTTISVTADGKTKTVTVNVTKENIEAESMDLILSADTAAVGDTITVRADVRPLGAWTANSSITYSVSDPEVAKLSGSTGKDCAVTLLKPGKFTITAVLNGTEITAVSKEITVLDVLSEEEQEQLIEEEGLGTLYYLVGVDEKLDDISLPKSETRSWEWTYPEDKPNADDALPYQEFEAVYKKDGFEPVIVRLPVHISKIEQVNIKGVKEALKGEEIRYQADCDYIGSYPEGITMVWSWTVDKGAENGMEILSGADSQVVDVKYHGEDTLHVKLTVTNPSTGNTNDYTAKQTVAVKTPVIRPAAEQPGNAIPVESKTDSVITIAADKFDKKTANKLALAIEGNPDVKWSVTDAGVMAVDKNGVVTIKKAGIATIKATAAEFTASVVIRVEDYAPALESGSVTIFQNDSIHTPIGLAEQNGNAIKEVTVSGVVTDSAKIEARKEDGKWVFIASGYQAKKTEKLTLTVKTDKIESKDYTVKVTVDVTKPDTKSVKFKQTATPNVFYCGTEAENAEFLVTSTKYEIKDISSTPKAGTYNVASYDSYTGKLVMKPNGLDKSSVKTFNNITTVNVDVAGYGIISMDIKVNIKNKKPAAKITDVNLVSEKHTSAAADLILDKKIVNTQGIIFKADSTMEGASVTAKDGRVSVLYSGSKGGTNKVTISRDSWTDDLQASGKINVVKADKLALEANAKKLTVNIRKERQNATDAATQKETVFVKANIKGNVELPVALKAKEAKGALTIREYSKDTFEVEVPADTKPGNYSIQIKGSLTDGTAVKPVNVTIAVVNKAAEVKVTPKGSINLANRTGTSVTCTPKFKNIPENLTITKVTLDDQSRKLFKSTLKDGKVIVSAYSYTEIKANEKYNVTMTFTMSNGEELKSAPFIIKPVDKLPKVKAVAKNKALYKANLEQEAVYQLNVDKGYTITRIYVEQDKAKNSTHFNVIKNADNTVSIRMNDTELKAGTYSLTCKALIREAGNVKPVKVTLKVVVK